MEEKGGVTMRKILLAVLLAVFLVSTGLLLTQFRDNSDGSDSYASALAIATSGSPKETAPPAETEEAVEEIWVPEEITGDEHMEALREIDIAALQDVNPDVIGWIRIPDSNIDYPLVRGTDNDYYLKHTWDGIKNSVGSIFMEHRNSAEFTDYNTILYGHNMNDGSMFANIRRYNTQWYWERHPYVYIATEDGVFRYEVFSSYESSIEGPAYGLSFHQEKTKANFLISALEKTVADLGIRPAMTDRILTLSTCSGMGYSNRWVLHARLKMVQAQ